ncbi:MAG TPA: hypothetical protein VKQ36_08980, partial [Ktedonobacterales bacterium]|nr:hypothetical protein [Ktedonobacterales bacterium]
MGGVKRWSQARWRAAFSAVIPARYALIALGATLLLPAARLADYVTGRRTDDWRAFIVLGATLSGLACLLLAASRLPPGLAASVQRARDWLRQRHALGGLWALVMLCVALLALVGIVVLAGCVSLITMEPLAQAYFNDVISFTYLNAKAVLAGQNPYTSDGLFAQALRRFPLAGATPLRRGAFGHGYAYPLRPQLAHVEQAYLRYLTAHAHHPNTPDPTDGAFDPRTLHS